MRISFVEISFLGFGDEKNVFFNEGMLPIHVLLNTADGILLQDKM
jgi:hypothetical protein